MTTSIKPQLQVELLTPETVEDPGGAWPLHGNPQEDWAWRKDVFAPHELDTIIKMAESLEFVSGRTGADMGQKQDTVTRNSGVKFIFPNALTSWVFQKLAGAVIQTNEQFFNFDLSGFEQGLQLTRYDADGEQHYDWHIDRGQQTGGRKLSLTVQLSDPNDYEGGNLELKYGTDNVVASRERGLITFFPSYVLHRVTPVTKGKRITLTYWALGPLWR